MIRAFSLFFRLLILLFIASLAMSIIMSFNEYKDQIKTFFRDHYRVQTVIDGDIKLYLYPTPHLKIEKAVISTEQNKQIYEGSIEIHINYNLLFDNNLEGSINNIEIANAKLDLEYLGDCFKASESNLSLGKLHTIKLRNIDISMGYGCISCIKVRNLDLSLSDALFGNSYSLSANFIFNGIDYNIKSSLEGVSADGKVKNALINLSNNVFALEISGSGNNLYKQPDFQGEAVLDIADLRKFSEAMIDIGVDSSDKQNLKSIFQKRSLLLNTKASLQNNSLKFFDLKLSGDGVSKFNGFVEMFLSLEEIEWHYSAEADLLDLDYFLEDNSSISDILQFFNNNDKHATLFDHFFSVYIDIKINRIALFHQDIKHFLLNADITGGELYINDMSFFTPGDGRFKLLGYYSKNSFRDRFDGTLSIMITDFNSTLKWLNNGEDDGNLITKVFLQSDIIAIPHRIKLNNIKAAFDDTLMLGRLNLVGDAKSNKTIEGALRFNALDFNRFGFGQKFDGMLEILFQSDHDKTSKTYFAKVEDHKWLRYIDYNINVDFMAEKTVFKESTLHNFFTSIEISQGLLSINDMTFVEEGGTYLKTADFTMKLDGIRPQIESSVCFDILNLEFFRKIMPKLGKISNASAEDVVNTYSIYNFSGVLDFKADQIFFGDEQLFSKLNAKLQIESGILSLVDFKAKMLKGEMIAVGNITAIEYVPQINFNFVLNNIDPGMLMEWATGVAKIHGYMSIGGSLTSSGETWSNMIKRLKGKAKVIGKNIRWDGSVDLGEVITVTDSMLSPHDKINRINYYLQNGSSFLNFIKGEVEIEGVLINFNNFEITNNRTSGAMAARYNYIDKTVNSIAKYSFFPIGVSSPFSIEFKSFGAFATPKTDVNWSKLYDFINGADKKNASKKSKSNEDLRSPTAISN